MLPLLFSIVNFTMLYNACQVIKILLVSFSNIVCILQKQKPKEKQHGWCSYNIIDFFFFPCLSFNFFSPVILFYGLKEKNKKIISRSLVVLEH